MYKRGKKYLWKIPTTTQTQWASIALSYNLSLPLAQVLYERGYTNPEQLNSYLFSSFEQDVTHGALLKDAQKAVQRIIQALDNHEKILIAGDYDVDGITSSALMMLCLMPLGANINFFLPHRVHDGYGLSVKTVERAAQNGYTLIVTVDNGITAFEPAVRAQELGIDLIITDHHRPHDHVPEAFAIINPHQHDCPYPYKKFAGVGVIFKLMTLLYEQKGLELPAKAYELMLLGTVADVVPLTGENRFWVRHGLRSINTLESYAFKVLKANGKVTKTKLAASDIGFAIAPQINALGRLEDPRQGVKFLIGSNNQEVEYVGKILLELNQTRKDIERTILAEIVMLIEQKRIDLDNENCIIAASHQWPPGVIGLVASRLVGMYGKPTILLHLTKEGLAKGSCRSISAFNMFDALTEARHLLQSFGGHSVAAGLSLKQENIVAVKEIIEARIAATLKPEDLQQKLHLDASISLPDVNKKLLTDMELLEPFGQENPQPLFYLENVCQIQAPQLLKDAHVKTSVFADGIIKPVVFFNRPDLFELLLQQGQEPLSMAVQVTENTWNGRTNIELQGLDVAV